MPSSAPCIKLDRFVDSKAKPNQRKLRLLALGKLWVHIELFHPYLAYKDIDWDDAFVKTIPKIDSVKSAADYREAVSDMLSALDDFQTYAYNEAVRDTDIAEDEESEPEAKPPKVTGRFRKTNDGIALFDLRALENEDCAELKKFIATKLDELEAPEAIVFDIRTHIYSCFDIDRLFDAELAMHLTKKPLIMPSFRHRYHFGSFPVEGTNPREYGSGFIVRGAHKLEGGSRSFKCPIIFLVNFLANTPMLAVALQTQEKGYVVTSDRFSSGYYGQSCLYVDMPDDLIAVSRLSELISDNGSVDFGPDVILDLKNGMSKRAVDKTLELIRTKSLKKVRRSKPTTGVNPPNRYSDKEFPSREFRLLAAFRIWAIIAYLFPYKDLMDRDWDLVLEEIIDEFEAASDSVEYYLAIAKMIGHLDDSHANVVCDARYEYFGETAPPVRCRIIEGKPVITFIANEKAATKAGIKIGDIVVSIDGQKAEERMKMMTPYFAASTPQARNNQLAWNFLNGPDKSTATLEIEEASGSLKSVKVKRSFKCLGVVDSPTKRGTDAVRILRGNFGYADLTRLDFKLVDDMFEQLKETRAIIFDMRGYPLNSGGFIAARLTEHDQVPAAVNSIPLVVKPHVQDDFYGHDPSYLSATSSVQKSSKWTYKSKTVLLIDERAISQAEQVGMFLKAANGTTFIGSPTNGANGTVTEFSVPGDIIISITGEKYFFPDGTQLQRVGLQPDVFVQPTIAGIRSGRDEVLERAIEWLNEHT